MSIDQKQMMKLSGLVGATVNFLKDMDMKDDLANQFRDDLFHYLNPAGVELMHITKNMPNIQDKLYDEALDQYMGNGIDYRANSISKADVGDLQQLASDSFFEGVMYALRRYAPNNGALPTNAQQPRTTTA